MCWHSSAGKCRKTGETEHVEIRIFTSPLLRFSCYFPGSFTDKHSFHLLLPGVELCRVPQISATTIPWHPMPSLSHPNEGDRVLYTLITRCFPETVLSPLQVIILVAFFFLYEEQHLSCMGRDSSIQSPQNSIHVEADGEAKHSSCSLHS